MKRPTLTEIAARIHAHMRRFETDPKINAPDPVYRTRNYYCAGAYRAGSFVGLRYVSYHCAWHLRRADAQRYLAWLDAGNVGTHYEMERAAKP